MSDPDVVVVAWTVAVLIMLLLPVSGRKDRPARPGATNVQRTARHGNRAWPVEPDYDQANGLLMAGTGVAVATSLTAVWATKALCRGG